MRQEFAVHLLNPTGIEKAKHLAEVFSNALEQLEALGLGPSREWSLVVTKMQEASFFAKRALAVRPDNQVES